jgi:uroporphyrinogen III methyltransferase/synthase
VPAYAGIPVTHRGFAQSFAVITGHEADEQQTADSKQQAVLPTADTLIFLMGVKTLPDTVRRLVEAGRSSDTPVAVIRWGTTPEQQTVTGTLADIVDRAEEAGITPPAITVVGEVVRLRETISWFEQRPLFGKRVLITRTRKQASVLAKLLADEGAIPIELPSIEIQPSYDEAAVEDAIEALGAGEYAWTVFTSANAVEIWMGLVQEGGYDARLFGHSNVAAIGPATARKLAAYGIIPDLVPEEFVAEGIVTELGKRLRPGKRPIAFAPLEDADEEEAIDASIDALFQEEVVSRREGQSAGGGKRKAVRILVPRAEGARPELIEGLTAAGAKVDEVTLYRAVVPSDAPVEALEMLRRGEIDIVTFTSSSTVGNLVAMLNGSDEALEQPVIAAIGPITAETARELGLRVDVEAAQHTVDGLVMALKDPQGLSREPVT